MKLIKSRATIKDVAKEAGVSIGVVSFVLNNTPGQSIPEETRQKVLAAVNKLNYIPNSSARGMRTKKSMTLGLAAFWDHRNLIFVELLDGVYNAASKRGYTVLISNLNSKEQEFSYIDLYKRQQLDGVIFASPYNIIKDFNEVLHIEKMKENFMPSVIIHGHTQDLTMNYVNIDYHGTGFLPVEYLVNLGHKRIGYTYPSIGEAKFRSEARLQGYFDAMRSCGLSIQQEFIVHEDEYDKLVVKIREGTGPTAIVAFRAEFAYKLMNCFTKNGVGIPGQVSIVAASESGFTPFFKPELTSVNIPIKEMGEKSVELLVERINGSKNIMSISLPNYINERESCKRLV